MKTIKCESCGATIQNNTNNCPYCGSTIIMDEQPNTKTETSTTIINNYYTTNTSSTTNSSTSSSSTKTPSARPKINVLLVIILFCFYFWPGLIYLFYVKGKQKDWDRQNNK